MRTKPSMVKNCLLLPFFFLCSAGVFAGSPQLVWHQAYGDAGLVQQLSVMAIDNYDNTFAAGFVNFGSAGNIIVNRYDGVGNLMWNRLFNNPQSANANDMPVALFPDNQAGVTVVGYVNGDAVVTHIFSYDGSGNLYGDVTIGDTAAGNNTTPVAVIFDGVSSYYMIGMLNNVSGIFKCSRGGNIAWSTPLHNAYNNMVGCLSFDPFGNIVVAVTDSLTAQVIIHRYDQNTGAELPGFNTHLSHMPVNGNFIHAVVDINSNIFLAATATDTAGRTQWQIEKFDTTGAVLWSTMCNSAKGHSNIINTFMLDHYGDVLVSGPFTDIIDTQQYAAVYKLSGDTGGVEWSYIDSLFLVNEAVVQVDLYSNVYLSTTKTPSTISPFYSQFSCTQLSPDSGIVQWNRSFDNSSDNTGLITQVNNFGDIFLATTTPTDTGSTWFLGRVGNAAGDSIGTAVKSAAGNLSELSVFPNPFTSFTNIRFTANVDERLWMKLFDITGQLIQEKPVQAAPGNNLISLQVAVTPGVYVLRLEGANTQLITPVVVY